MCPSGLAAGIVGIVFCVAIVFISKLHYYKGAIDSRLHNMITFLPLAISPRNHGGVSLFLGVFFFGN